MDGRKRDHEIMPKSSSAKEREIRRMRGAGEGRASRASFSKSLKNASAASVGFTLDHVHRACFRPTIPTALQVEVAKKLGISRRALGREGSTIEILKPLYDLSEAFYCLGYQISNSLAEETRNIYNLFEEASRNHKEDFIERLIESTCNSVRDVEVSVLKNQIKCAQKNIKQLSELMDVIGIVKSAICRIQRERPRENNSSTVTEEHLGTDIVGNIEQMEECLKIVETAEYLKLAKEVSLPLKECLARTKRALLSNSVCTILWKPLLELKKAIEDNTDEDIYKAIQSINKSIDKYDSLQIFS